jgi:uncharacterized protein YbaP (TraB family)
MKKRRMCQQVLLLLLVGITSLEATAAVAEKVPLSEALSYDRLSSSKALAVIPGAAESHTSTHSQPNDLMAAISALRTCEASRSPKQAACELRKLNDEIITSGAEIRAQAPAREHPLYLWQIESPTATVFLAGSVHILKPSLYPLPPVFDAAFAAADTLVVEVNVDAVDPTELRVKTISYATLPDGQRIQTVLPESLTAELAMSLNRYGVPLTQVETLTPAFLMNQIVLLRLTSLGYQGEHGVEQHYLRQLGDRRLLELETLDDQLSLLFNQPMNLQRQLLIDTLDQEAGIEPLVAGMIGAWFSGDDAQFMEMFEAQSGDSELTKQFTEQLLDHRNLGMADKIQGYLNSGNAEVPNTYFVLAGAAHLIGEKGIIALLEARGVETQRLTSRSTIH